MGALLFCGALFSNSADPLTWPSWWGHPEPDTSRCVGLTNMECDDPARRGIGWVERKSSQRKTQLAQQCSRGSTRPFNPSLALDRGASLDDVTKGFFSREKNLLMSLRPTIPAQAAFRICVCSKRPLLPERVCLDQHCLTRRPVCRLSSVSRRL